MFLTENFTLEEFIVSQTAIRNGISNSPSNSIVKNINALCVNTLQPLREIIRKPIIITSGYRSTALNRIIGGASKSQHCLGEAADIIVPGMQACNLFASILMNNIKYDQIILEFNRWVHISYREKELRGNVLLAKHLDGNVVYERVFNT